MDRVVGQISLNFLSFKSQEVLPEDESITRSILINCLEAYIRILIVSRLIPPLSVTASKYMPSSRL